jgi:hypothetical protein
MTLPAGTPDPTTRHGAGEILALDPATYRPHALHTGDVAWPETNCYVDLWIEALHAFGLPPEAAMAFTLGLDFEGDQWTFYKFPTHDLEELFGVDVQELTIWKSPERHVAEQVARGRLVMMEVDAFYLPDVRGTSYRAEHTKTTIGIQAIDVGARTLGYFHNAGYHRLAGEDFVGVLRLDDPPAPGNPRLLAFTELVKLDRLARRPPSELAKVAVVQLRRHLGKRPRENPFHGYRDRLRDDVDWLRSDSLLAFHQYAFATVRQVGSAYQCAAALLRFLAAHGEPDLDPPTRDLDALAQEAKALQFKLARAVNAKRALDVNPPIDALAALWDRVMGHLVLRYL